MSRNYLNHLQGTTIDILNTIRQNAGATYQANVPNITKYNEIPKVGEILQGYPALANEFISTLINRVALTLIRSTNAENNLAPLKKGTIKFGERIDEVFVEMAKAREFKPELAPSREFARTLPDVRTAFHGINWKAQYPITISRVDLYRAFESEEGVLDLTNKIVGSVVEAQNYDEYLLTKYLILKAIAKGECAYVAVNASDYDDMAAKFRGYSNKMTFINTEYNNAHVHVATPKQDQYILMDAAFNAAYDVNQLASAFNMDKATYQGNLLLIDDFASFDNDRFDTYRADCDGLETVTATELGLTDDVKAVLMDKEFVQMYDALYELTETQVNSGMYINYFLNVMKVVSYSPFSNCIAFVASAAVPSAPSTLTATLESIEETDTQLIYMFGCANSGKRTEGERHVYQASTDVANGIAIHPFGGYILPKVTSGGSTTIKRPTYMLVDYMGYKYKGSFPAPAGSPSVAPKVGDTVTLTKQS